MSSLHPFVFVFVFEFVSIFVFPLKLKKFLGIDFSFDLNV